MASSKFIDFSVSFQFGERMRKIGIIIAREFNERVRKKSFIVTTILMPLLMIGLMVTPTLIMQFSSTETKHVAVIDESGAILPALESGEEAVYEPTDLSLDAARRELTDRFAILWIGADVMENPSNVKLYTNTSSSMEFESNLSGAIADVIEKEKLKAYNIDNLDQILAEIDTDVYLQVFRNDASQEEDEAAGSSAMATAVGFILGMVLYMFLIIYGGMVMQSVIDEKSNRVLEVVVSSVSPFQLMMGKILCIASVAVVQVLIWAVLIGGVGTLVMPQLIPAETMTQVEAMQAGTLDAAAAGADMEMLQSLASITDPGYIATIFGYLLLFIVGGYLLYSAIFAAIGSAVDNAQDSQQLQTPVMMPIILSIIVMMMVMKDPNSPIVFWCSLIPFTSPIVMMARIPCGIATWEIVLSLVLLYASFIGMVWVAAKIYRVGIFMYGKKPTFKELYKWMKYKY